MNNNDNNAPTVVFLLVFWQFTYIGRVEQKDFISFLALISVLEFFIESDTCLGIVNGTPINFVIK